MVKRSVKCPTNQANCRVWARAASLCVNGKLLDGGGAMVGRSFYEAVNAARKAVIVFARSRCAVEKWSCARKRVGKLVVRKMAGSLNAELFPGQKQSHSIFARMNAISEDIDFKKML
jgi:hypothetical protein